MANQDHKSYYCVYVYNRYNYAHCQSPEFDTLGECHAWLKKYLIDKGSTVEIREVRSFKVSGDDYDSFDYDYNKGLSYSAQDIASKLLWDYGCIDKDYFVRNKASAS